MRPFFSFILVLLALAPFLPDVAAQPDFRYHCKESYTFTIDMRTARDPVAQYFLQEICRGNNNGLDKTSYSIVFDTDIRLEKASDTIYTLDFLMDIGKITGDTRYKTFDVSHYLIPANILTVLTWTEQNGHFLDTLTLNKKAFGNTISYSIPRKSSETDPSQSHFPGVLTLQPVYQDCDRDELQKYLSVIDDYYVSDAILDTVIHLLNQCENGSILDLENKILNLLVCDQLLYHLSQKYYHERLPLYAHDPVSFMTTYRGLIYRYDHLRNAIFHLAGTTVKQMQPVTWNKLAKAYTNRFMSFIELSYLVNFYEVSYYHELAKVIYTQSRIAAFQPFFWKLGNTVNLNLHQLYQALVQQWLDQARRKVDQELYYDSFVPIDNAAYVVSLNFAKSSEPAIKQVRTIAYHGMYSSYLNLASRFYDMGDLALCDTYLGKAFELVTQNPAIVIPDTLFCQIMENIAGTHIRQAVELPDTLRGKKLACLQKARESICKYFPVYSLLDSITIMQLQVKEQMYMAILDKWESSIEQGEMTHADVYATQAIDYAMANLNDPLYRDQAFVVIRKIHGYTYQTMLYEAERLIELGDHTTAVVRLQEADALAVAYGIPMSSAYLALLHSVYTPVFMEKMSRGRMYVWLNEIDKADNIFRECQDLAERNHLTADPEVLIALKELQDLIRQK